MKLITLSVALFLSALALPALCHAGSPEVINTDPKSGIVMKIIPCFEGQPSSGYSPVRFYVRNRTDSTHSWTISAESPGDRYNSDRAQTINSRFQASVPAGEERTFDFLIPTADVLNSNSFSITIQGYGSMGIPVDISLGGYYSNRVIGNFGFSEQLNLSITNLKSEMNKKSVNDTVATINFATVPPDWRALLGFDQIWLPQSEYESLPAATRGAMDQWVATGGHLYLCAPNAKPATKKSGFGVIRSFASEFNTTLDISTTLDRMMSPQKTIHSAINADYKKKWPEKEWMPIYEANAPLLVGVIILFGVLVGPFNFFVLSAREKRHRIFWMTPLISILGTAIIGLAILVQDGIGGWGRRFAIILLQPEKNLEIIHQDQASRTGVLLQSSFQIDPTSVLHSIPLGDRSKSFSYNGTNVSGDFFENRAVQVQSLTAVRPSRARIELQNPAEIAAGAKPRLISTIGTNLKVLFYVSSGGAIYKAENVSPGRPVTLEKSDEAQMKTAFDQEEFRYAGPRLHSLANFSEMTPGWFYAAASQPAQGTMIDTLRSLDWRKDRAFYLGPVLGSPTP